MLHFLFCVIAQAAESDLERKVALLLESLYSEAVEVREAAAEQLEDLGPRVGSVLEKQLAKEQNPEVAARIHGLLAKFKRKEWLGTNFLSRTISMPNSSMQEVVLRISKEFRTKLVIETDVLNSRRIDFSVENATLWACLCELSRISLCELDEVLQKDLVTIRGPTGNEDFIRRIDAGQARCIFYSGLRRALEGGELASVVHVDVLFQSKTWIHDYTVNDIRVMDVQGGWVSITKTISAFGVQCTRSADSPSRISGLEVVLPVKQFEKDGRIRMSGVVTVSVPNDYSGRMAISSPGGEVNTGGIKFAFEWDGKRGVHTCGISGETDHPGFAVNFSAVDSRDVWLHDFGFMRFDAGKPYKFNRSVRCNTGSPGQIISWNVTSSRQTKIPFDILLRVRE